MSVALQHGFSTLHVSAAAAAEREWLANIARSSVKPTPTVQPRHLRWSAQSHDFPKLHYFGRFKQNAFVFDAGAYVRLPTPFGFRRAAFFVGDTVRLRTAPWETARFTVLKTRACSGPRHVVGHAPHAELLIRSHQTQREFWVCQDDCTLLTIYAGAPGAPGAAGGAGEGSAGMCKS